MSTFFIRKEVQLATDEERNILSNEILESLTISNTNFSSFRHFAHLWHIIYVVPPSEEEISQILKEKFPSIIHVAVNKLTQSYVLLNSYNYSSNSTCLQRRDGQKCSVTETLKLGNSAKFSGASCSFTLRDLMKVCERINRLISGTFNRHSNILTSIQRLQCVREIVDVYALKYRGNETYVSSVAYSLGNLCWDLTNNEIDSFIMDKKQTVEVKASGNEFNFGRARLARNISDLNIFSNSVAVAENTTARVSTISQAKNNISYYALTSTSAALLEKIAMCVMMNEPVLLVGETGSGKTTAIQEIAQQIGQKLLVQNLSLSVDANDLLGGFRPVNMKQLLQPCYEKFVLLFQNTFSASQNAEYLQIVASAFKKRTWKRLLKAFLKAVPTAKERLESAIETMPSAGTCFKSFFKFCFTLMLAKLRQ
jgi:midasin